MQSYQEKENRVLDLLHQDCRNSLEQMATMLDMTTQELAEIIDNLEKTNVILGYGARINWDLSLIHI